MGRTENRYRLRSFVSSLTSPSVALFVRSPRFARAPVFPFLWTQSLRVFLWPTSLETGIPTCTVGVFSTWRTKSDLSLNSNVEVNRIQTMSQSFYSVALAVLTSILVRWCVSLSSYSGKICLKATNFLALIKCFCQLTSWTYTRLQVKENLRCLEITKRRGTGWKSLIIYLLMNGNVPWFSWSTVRIRWFKSCVVD